LAFIRGSKKHCALVRDLFPVANRANPKAFGDFGYEADDSP
jgi:hypothetical protein